MLRTQMTRLSYAVVLVAAFGGVALAGPPWLSIEYPVNPHDPNTRGAFMTIRTYHHGTPMSYEISGTAEGLVGGRRQSARLDIRRLPTAGSYVVRWQKPAQGSWVLHIVSTRDGDHAASALVSVNSRGRVAGVSVPSDPIEGGRFQVPRRVGSAEIEAMLRNATE